MPEMTKFRVVIELTIKGEIGGTYDDDRAMIQDWLDDSLLTWGAEAELMEVEEIHDE